MVNWDDVTDPHVLENLRRSVVMLSPGQIAPIDRERALALMNELQRLQGKDKQMIAELRELLSRHDASSQ